MNSGLADRDPDKMSRYSGFFKSVQSLGAALSWWIDSSKYSYRFQLALCWGLLLLSLPTTLLASNRLSNEVSDVEFRKPHSENQPLIG